MCVYIYIYIYMCIYIYIYTHTHLYNILNLDVIYINNSYMLGRDLVLGDVFFHTFLLFVMFYGFIIFFRLSFLFIFL